MFLKLRRDPHLFQSCLRVVQNGFPLATREMQPFFKNLAIIDALGIQASFMDFHHNTSLRSILEYDPISSTFRTYIHFCLGKGAWLWLVVRPSIHSFCITHFIFTLTLHFHLSLIQPLTSNFFTCECGHGLDTFGIHLIRCSFGGQQVATHDAIQDIMYAFA